MEHEKTHSQWKKWDQRNEIPNIDDPGIYIIAISENDLSEQDFSWRKEIKYIGMTNSRAGLKGRLTQFDNTIKGKKGHGGAERFRCKYQKYAELAHTLYVSVVPFKCNVTNNSPTDLLIMGEVAKYEYVCFAKHVDLFQELPEFNDKQRSPKYDSIKCKKNILKVIN